jgi:hypothetical protein
LEFKIKIIFSNISFISFCSFPQSKRFLNGGSSLRCRGNPNQSAHLAGKITNPAATTATAAATTATTGFA